jgi:hypothetical protein
MMGMYLNPVRPKRIHSMRWMVCTSERAVTNMVGWGFWDWDWVVQW